MFSFPTDNYKTLNLNIEKWCYKDISFLSCIASSSPGSVRLFGGDGSSGVVETLYNGKWGMICDSSFGTTAATVVCSQLGFYGPESSSITASSRY